MKINHWVVWEQNLIYAAWKLIWNTTENNCESNFYKNDTPVLVTNNKMSIINLKLVYGNLEWLLLHKND